MLYSLFFLFLISSIFLITLANWKGRLVWHIQSLAPVMLLLPSSFLWAAAISPLSEFYCMISNMYHLFYFPTVFLKLIIFKSSIKPLHWKDIHSFISCHILLVIFQMKFQFYSTIEQNFNNSSNNHIIIIFIKL